MLSVIRWLRSVVAPAIYIASLKKRGLTVGDRLSVQRDVIIDSKFCHLISIGDDCTLAPGAVILAHDASMRLQLGFTRVAKVKLGNRVFVGAGAIILPGVTIGDDAVIGAGSIVSKSVAPSEVVAGNPAVRICSTEDFAERHRRTMKEHPEYYIP